MAAADFFALALRLAAAFFGMVLPDPEDTLRSRINSSTRTTPSIMFWYILYPSQ